MKLSELKGLLDRSLAGSGLPPLTDDQYIETVAWMESAGQIKVDGDEVWSRFNRMVEVMKGQGGS